MSSSIGAAFESIYRKDEELTDEERWELQKRKRQLDAQLAAQEISYSEHATKVKEINKELSERIFEDVNSIRDAFIEGFKSIGTFVLDIISSIIQQLTAAVTQALALKAISSLFGIGPVGSIGSLIQGNLGVGGSVTGPAQIQIGGTSNIEGNDIRTSYKKQTITNNRLFN